METNTNIPSYKEGLKELRGNLKEMLPTESLSGFDQYAEDLQEEETNILKLKKGDKAPEFSLSNQTGDTLSLSDLLQKGKTVLVFYRGAWCPYCNLQLNQYQQALGKIKEQGATLVAVSPQTPDMSLSMKEKNNLKFEVLNDVGNNVAKLYTSVYRHSDKATSILTGLGIDFNSHYSDDSHEVPVPAVFVIDTDGTVLLAKTEGGDYRNRVEVAEVLKALKA